MFKNIILIALCLIANNSFGISREENIERLVKAQGLSEIFDQQIEQQKIETKKQSNLMMEQIQKEFYINQETANKLAAATDEYYKKIMSSWTSEQMVVAWSKFYGSKFTDSELEQLVTFAESPLGQKDRKVSKEAIYEYTIHFSKLSQPILAKARKEYFEDVKKSLALCGCKK